MRVLIVDDREDNRYLLCKMLQGNGFEVEEAVHGAQALELARANVPDLVISDLLMPVMDGYTLLRQWKADEALQGKPFMVYTATYTEPKDEKLALDMGADDFIVKPAEPEFFMQRVNEVLQAAARRLPLPCLAQCRSGWCWWFRWLPAVAWHRQARRPGHHAIAVDHPVSSACAHHAEGRPCRAGARGRRR